MTIGSQPNKRQQIAIERLDNVVASLKQQHTRQLTTRCASEALFWGLAVSALAVLWIRLARFPISVSLVTVVLIALALIVRAIVAWRHQPDALSVAIIADHQLGLKQQLSTAWEFRQSQPDSDVTRALAVQAVGHRTPTLISVFPHELNLWGMLVPLGFAALLLTNMVDPQEHGRIPEIQSKRIDTLVVDEGIRLEAFARRMKHRADQAHHRRSQVSAGNLQRLGAEMASGALVREQALSGLQRMERTISMQRTAVLDEARESGEDSMDMPSSAAPNKSHAVDLEALQYRMLAGELSPENIQMLDRARTALTGSGISEDALRQALDQYAEGDLRALQRILQSLSSAAQGELEAEELAKARTAVARASENLGGDAINEQNAFTAGTGNTSEERGADGLVGDSNLADFEGQMDNEGDGSYGSIAPFNRLSAEDITASSLSDDTQVTLKANTKRGPGDSFKSQTWALPKIGTPGIQSVAIDARFERQMEAVLSKERYPLHRKEFVRRYFLNLSTGVQEISASGENKP